MKILQPLTMSFEFFPPKSPEGFMQLVQVAQALKTHQPEFFSVTFGAGGSTRKGTLDTVKLLMQKTHVNIAPHIACIGSTQDEMISLLDAYQTLGIKRLVVLRGDLPSGLGKVGEFNYAYELVSLIREHTGDCFYIEVAAYPEIHPQAQTPQQDLLSLKMKFEAGANSAITQYFFNSDAYFYLIEACAQQHITLPIIPGIMPITQFHRLARFSDACGAEIPRWIRKRLEAYGDDVESLKAFGLEVTYNLCERLITGGAPGLHLYTLNKAEASIALLKAIQGSIPEVSDQRLQSKSAL